MINFCTIILMKKFLNERKFLFLISHDQIIYKLEIEI